MKLTPPSKDVEIEQWSVADHERHQRTGEKPINPAWLKYKSDALRAAGLDDEAAAVEPDETPLEDLTAEQHFERLRQR